MDIRPDELLAAIHLPRSRNARTHYYRKVGTRKAQAISKVCFAAVAESKGTVLSNVRIALGSVAPIPIRCEKTEAVIQDQTVNDEIVERAATTLAAEIAPIDDIRSTRDYRLQVSLNLLRDFLSRAAAS
jgi:CO/xanthine dehydrogenase FAD-binding subunit